MVPSMISFTTSRSGGVWPENKSESHQTPTDVVTRHHLKDNLGNETEMTGWNRTACSLIWYIYTVSQKNAKLFLP